MSEEQVRHNRVRNRLQTLLILSGMTVLLGFMGFVLGGTVGLCLVTLLGMGFLLFAPHARPELAMRMARAQRVGAYEAPRLSAMVQALAQRAQLPAMPVLYYVPSSTLNAFAAGSPRHAAIAVTDGLVRLLDSRELLGVLAHEITHLKHNDLKVMNLAASAHQMTSSFANFGQILLLINLPLYLFTSASIPWLFVLALLLAPLVSQSLQMALSRTREFDADLGAAQLTGDPDGLASALAKLEHFQRGFFERLWVPMRRQPQVPAWLRTHPDTVARIQRLRALRANVHPVSVAPVRTYPRRASPRRANPRWANPRRAYPRRANPRRANPRRANPHWANPRRANPHQEPWLSI